MVGRLGSLVAHNHQRRVHRLRQLRKLTASTTTSNGQQATGQQANQHRRCVNEDNRTVPPNNVARLDPVQQRQAPRRNAAAVLRRRG
ncbi:hypothetical protein HPB50_017669 [Hyalomma asiaticum]|uniref:Uncharacterized protein n=1 Tax=Hyalomma asiaticum TaxID=266040 RepID=A0ACB7SFR0_HYAAI|nr:hypothetical protein HPB50_017669 [Hyalomma asiaticum]